MPSDWLVGQMTLVPKVPRPRVPRDMRPICLSSVPCKVFTRVVLDRLRTGFPPLRAGQIMGRPGAQVLAGSMSAQHLIRLSNAWGLALVLVKLDISSAFDTLSHAAIARYLSLTNMRVEAELLMQIIAGSSVYLGLGPAL